MNVKAAQTRIQKMITDGENEERTGQLLMLNDLINGVLHNYDCFKTGRGERREILIADHLDATPQSLPPTTGAICLIDLDDDISPTLSVQSGSANQQANTGDLLGGLSGLDFSSPIPVMGQKGTLGVMAMNQPSRSPSPGTMQQPPRSASPAREPSPSLLGGVQMGQFTQVAKQSTSPIQVAAVNKEGIELTSTQQLSLTKMGFK